MRSKLTKGEINSPLTPSFIKKRIAIQEAYIKAVACSNRQFWRKQELMTSARQILDRWKRRLGE